MKTKLFILEQNYSVYINLKTYIFKNNTLYNNSMLLSSPAH